MRRFASQRILIFAIIVIVVTFLSFAIGGYRINLTPSYPLGIYQITDGPLSYRDFIIACPVPSATTVYARKKEYLFYGTCPGNYSTLLKQIMAMPGDIVSRTPDQSLMVNGDAISNSQYKRFDQYGFEMPLPSVGIVPEKEFWLLSNHHSGSLDSRYLGAFPRHTILNKVVPVWIIE
jgi:conjugative transfer signal peptidase TraF